MTPRATSVYLWVASALCLACGSQSIQAGPQGQGPGSGRSVPATDQGSGIPRCGGPEGEKLQTYEGLGAGDELHYLTVHYEPTARQWVPLEAIEMPRHHATRLSWSNLEDFAPLPDAQDEQLRFTFEVLARETRQRPSQQVFMTEFRARVVTLCSTSAGRLRPEGALLGAIGLDLDACVALEAEVLRIARELDACARDEECGVVETTECDVQGIGCYWAAVNSGRSPGSLHAAIDALHANPCPISSCDCPRPPSSSRCVDGHCVAP